MYFENANMAIGTNVEASSTMILPYASILDSNSKPSLPDILHSDHMKPWDRYELDNVKVIPLSSNAASICYEVEASRGKHVYDAMYVPHPGTHFLVNVHSRS